MVTDFLVNPRIFFHLVQNPDEQKAFIDKASEYYTNYCIQKNIVLKNDETLEFKDKSMAIFIYDDVKDQVFIKYEPRVYTKN